MTVKSDKCPNENTSRLGSCVGPPLIDSGGMCLRVPSTGVIFSGVASGSMSIIQALSNSIILVPCWESSSTFLAVKS